MRKSGVQVPSAPRRPTGPDVTSETDSWPNPSILTAEALVAECVRIVQPVTAGLDELWHACATAEGLQSWQADEVDGELGVGQRLRLGWPALGVSLIATVEEVIPNRRVVLASGGWRTALECHPGCVTLVHSGSTSMDEREGSESAWRVSLATLAHQLKEHRRAARNAAWAISAARLTAAQAHFFFTDATALGAWLTAQGAVGPAGTECQLAMRWGAQLTGQVLANTERRDVAIAWQEQGKSVLALRTLPSPTSPDERWIALQWSTWTNVAGYDLTVRQLTSALDRLCRLARCRAQA